MHPDEIALNEYVDGTLDAVEETRITEHMAECGDCQTLVSDLRSLKTAASALGGLMPPDRVWREIHQRAFDKPAAAHEPPWWAFAAAAAALIAAVWIGSRMAPSPAGAPSAAAGQAASASRDTVEAELREAEQHYVNAINALQQIAAADQSRLDPDTVATLQRNLALIDQAINESRAALDAQPASDTARASLFDGLRAKIALLNDAVALMGDPRNKG